MRHPVCGSQFAELRRNLRMLGREALLVEIVDLMAGQFDFFREILQRCNLPRLRNQLRPEGVQFLSAGSRPSRPEGKIHHSRQHIDGRP